jgi:Flp pilus assembly protein TadG
MMIRHLRELCRDTRGHSFLELGFALPIMASLLIGAVDISRGVSEKLATEQAAQRTIELLQLKDFVYTDRATYQAEAAAAAGVASSAVTVNAWLQCNGTIQTPMDQAHYDGTCSNSSDIMARYVTVEIQKTFTPMFGTKYFPGANVNGTFTLKAKAGVRVQ